MIEINLHPAGEKTAARRRGKFSLGLPGWLKGGIVGRDPLAIASVAIALVAIGGLAALWLLQRGEARELERRLTTAVADSARLSDLRMLSDSLLERERLIRERVELVSALDGGRFVWPHLLDEISRALPEFTWLTAVKRESPLPDLTVQIQGLAASPLAITSFVRNLTESPYVSEVRIQGSQQQPVGDLLTQSFTLVIRYGDPPPALVRTRPLGPEEL